MACANAVKLLCFVLIVARVCAYVYRPGKRDTRVYLRKQFCVHQSFIKELPNVEPRKQLGKLVTFPAKKRDMLRKDLFAESIMRKISKVNQLRKTDETMEQKMTGATGERLNKSASSRLQRMMSLLGKYRHSSDTIFNFCGKSLYGASSR